MGLTQEGLEALEVPGPPVEERARMPLGFAAAAATAGIKASGRPDLALLTATGATPASVGAVYTTNRFPAAPIALSRRHLSGSGAGGSGSRGWTRAIVSSSGCANAATGPAGEEDQRGIAEAVAAALSVRPEETLALSTGLIGTRLPVDRVRTALPALVKALRPTDDGLRDAAEAMCTTDTRPKWASVTLAIPGAADGGRVTVTGIAKGVGMIHPGMATMLAVLLTDAAVAPELLERMIRGAAVRTWNQLTVDGDTSTNDTVFLLASGAAGVSIDAEGPGLAGLSAAVEAVARSLARQQAADGEGATVLLTCQVSGAADDLDARAVARSVVASSLVKAALHGRDPNWGRILAAVGNARLPGTELLEAGGLDAASAAVRAGSPPRLEIDRLRIAIAGSPVFLGKPVPFDAPAVRAAMGRQEVLVRVDLGLGSGTGEAFGCDLTEAYVVENSAYST